MAKRCAREECGKSVYPMEELKCLDKVWHKTCFKCTVCGMALNMKTYKGYNKMPYCEPHYPKTVASVVNDTPEMRRIAENTKNQSQIAYHAEYEKMKGTKIEVADDPETIRHKQNTHTQSNVAYHGDLEKKNRYEAVRPKEVPGDESMPPPQKQVGSIADYDPMNGQWGTVGNSNIAQKLQELEIRTPATHEMNYMNMGNGNSHNVQQNRISPQFSPSGKAGFAVKAIYDYNAQDKDEISFLEGDIIVNCEKVDEGWMTGTVQRTLQWGMLPANYVQPHKIPTGLHRIK